MDFVIAVSSFIVKDSKLLLIKRTSGNKHFANAWEIPGGRLEVGEDPIQGVKREAKEETGIDVEVLHPLSVKHFVREDGQTVTKLNFLCRALSSDVKLSEEHSVFEWVPNEKSKENLVQQYHHLVDAFNKLELKKLL